MNNPLISVIVPIYNAEKYLNKCVESLLNQTLKQIEIILIDDGSTDKSPVICDEYAKKDNRIKVIHQSNGGVSFARNEGLKIASGKFITFLDSDDYIEPNTYEVAYNTAVENYSECVVWGYFCDFVDENEKIVNQTIVIPYAKQRELKQRDTNLNLSGYLWNKLYSKKLLDELNLFFDENITLYEDLLFNTKYMLKANKSVYISKAFTHYMQRNILSLGKKYRENYFELANIALNCHIELLRLWKIEENIIDSYIVEQNCKIIWGAMRNICSSNLNKKEKCSKIQQICKRENYVKDIISPQNITIKDIIKKLILLTRCSKLICKFVK